MLLPFVGRSLWAKRAALREHWKLFLVMGVALGPFGNAAVYVAYHFTTAINGGVVSTAQPVATVLLSFLLFRDPDHPLPEYRGGDCHSGRVGHYFAR